MSFLKSIFWFFGCQDGSNEKPIELKKPVIKMLSNSDEERLNLIMDQMQYYLSAANLRANKQLNKLVNSNPGRYVPLTIFLEYNKMKNLNATIEEIHDACVISYELELNDQEDEVRTTLPVDLNYQAQIDRSFRLTNIPLDCQEHDLRKYLSENFGVVEKLSFYHSVIEYKRVFNGAASITFKSESIAKIFPPKFEYEGTIIDVEPLDEYQRRVKKERAERRNQNQKSK